MARTKQVYRSKTVGVGETNFPRATFATMEASGLQLVKTQAQCLECGLVLQKNNLRRHRMNIHGILGPVGSTLVSRETPSASKSIPDEEPGTSMVPSAQSPRQPAGEECPREGGTLSREGSPPRNVNKVLPMYSPVSTASSSGEESQRASPENPSKMPRIVMKFTKSDLGLENISLGGGSPLKRQGPPPDHPPPKRAAVATVAKPSASPAEREASPRIETAHLPPTPSNEEELTWELARLYSKRTALSKDIYTPKIGYLDTLRVHNLARDLEKRKELKEILAASELLAFTPDELGEYVAKTKHTREDQPPVVVTSSSLPGEPQKISINTGGVWGMEISLVKLSD